MMLKAIQKFDRKTREGLLAELALCIGRPPLAADDWSMNDDLSRHENFLDAYTTAIRSCEHSEVHFEILREITRRLSIDQNEYLYESKARVIDFIGKEIKELALDSKQIASVRKRLGQKGMLPPKAYQVKFPPEFSELCEPLGITRKEVLKVINTPDMLEHFSPEFLQKGEAISLYVRSYLAVDDPYSLLIDTRRVGDQIFVHYAIRVFHSDIDVSEVGKPSDLLRAFTDKFGEEVLIGGQRGKLLLYTTIPEATNEFSISFKTLKDSAIDIRASHRTLDEGGVEVSIAYGINVAKYVKSLRQHGIHTSREPN